MSPAFHFICYIRNMRTQSSKSAGRASQKSSRGTDKKTAKTHPEGRKRREIVARPGHGTVIPCRLQDH